MSEQNSKMNIPILYEDNHLLVVVKPANLPTNEDESVDDNLLDQLREYIKVKYQKPGDVYIGLVHRLDRPTGGVMVFARTSKAAKRLSEQIRERKMKKTYLAVAEGHVTPPMQKLVHYLQKNSTQNQVNIAEKSFPQAKEAVLEYAVLEIKEDKSLVEVNLETGRSHQIRAQMSYIGFPIVGDGKYGQRIGATKSLALWAFRLEFEHPVTKEKLNFKALPPQEYPWDIFDLSYL